MKIKTLLIALSIIGFLSLSVSSCSKDGEMGDGGTAGGPPPPFGSTKSGYGLQTDSIAVYDLPKD